MCASVSERQTQSAKSYNCRSVLQAQSSVPAPLIQHTHCTFSRSMIPLCLTHNLSTHTQPHAHIPFKVHQLTHTHILHTYIQFSSFHHPFTPAPFLMFSYTSFFLFHPFFSLKPWAITHQDSREAFKWEGREQQRLGKKQGDGTVEINVRAKENCLSVTAAEHLKTSVLK